MNGESKVSVYFHIPFCKKKCDYCNFYTISNKDVYKTILMNALKIEWERWKESLSGKEIVSIYFGGGTPSLVGPANIHEILSWVNVDDAEITLEVNPEDVTLSLMQEFRSAGINRVSIGVQSFNDDLLSKISRTHSAKQAIDAVLLTKEAKISNISIDLMYDLPTQTEKIWQETMDEACSLPITHIALYDLVIAEKAALFKREERSYNMYKAAIKTCADYNFEQYEIAAFQKSGFYSRHNTGYWTGRPFLGFGPSAFSYWEGKRFKNVSNLNKYCKILNTAQSPMDFVEELSPRDKIKEWLVINLRLIEGVNLDLFNLDPETKEAIDRLKKQGLLTQKGNILKMTKKGVLFYDRIAVELI